MEYIYLLTNPAMPEYVKIGRTNNIPIRLQNLSRATSVPEPFTCYGYLIVKKDKVNKIEYEMHKLLSKSVTKSKEFFKTSPEEAWDFFKSVANILDCEIVYYNQPLKKENQKKAKKTTFSLLEIPIGSVLSYTENKNIKCVVNDNNNKVNFDGTITTLSFIVRKLKEVNSADGFNFFVYDNSEYPNETLSERRKRLELQKSC